MKSPPKAVLPTLLRILLHSGFGAKTGSRSFLFYFYRKISQPKAWPDFIREPDWKRAQGICLLLQSLVAFFAKSIISRSFK